MGKKRTSNGGKQPAGKTAALDLGKARVGLAVSDELGMLAHPRPPLDGRNQAALLTNLVDLAEDETITHFVVGLPLHLDGREGSGADRARRFCQKLATRANVTVELIDERLSTVQAERALKEAGATRAEIKKRIDGAAAALLLQLWLDRRTRERDSPAPPS